MVWHRRSVGQRAGGVAPARTRRTLRASLARAGVLAIALGALAAPATALADSIPAVGINDIRSDGILVPDAAWNGIGDLGLAQSVGVQLYRARMQLNCVDPAHSGAFDFTSPSPSCGGVSYDQLVGALAARNITLLPVLINYDALNQSPQPPTVDGAGGSPTTSEFAAFAAAAAARYGPNGTFWSTCGCVAHPIDAWEIWNEENNGFWWSGAVSPSGYASVFSVTRAALRSVDAQAVAVVGGLAFSPNGQPSFVAPRAIIHALAAGNANAFDAVAVHPYTRDASQTAAQLADSALTMIDHVAKAVVTATGPAPNGGPRQQIWVTEMGWSSQAADPTTIAAGLQTFLGLLQDGGRARDNVGPVLWYDLRDNSVLGTRDDQLGLRLTAANGSDAGPKPAWNVFAAAVQSGGTLAIPPALPDSRPYIAPAPKPSVAQLAAVRKAEHAKKVRARRRRQHAHGAKAHRKHASAASRRA